MDSVWSSPLLELSEPPPSFGRAGKAFRPSQAACCSVCGVVELGGIELNSHVGRDCAPVLGSHLRLPGGR